MLDPMQRADRLPARGRGHLRPGVSVDEATDVLWTYNSAGLYEMLVIRRGWTPERYGSWVADALIAALLG